MPLVVAGLAARLSTIIHAGIVANEPTAGQSVAAVIVAGLTFILVTIPASSIAVGVQALVSRKAGADQASEIGPIITTGLLLSAFCTFVLSLAAAFLAPVLYPLIDSTVAISDEAIKYLRILLITTPAFVVVQILAAVFIGLNHPSRSLMVLVGMLVLDTAVAAYLVPTFGVEGAAIGSFVGNVAAMLLFFAQWPGFAKQQGIRLAAATNDVLRGLWEVAGPISVRRAMRPVQVMLLLWILGQLNSPIDLIVGTLLIKLSLLAQAPGGAFGKAAAVLAAHDLWGDKIRRARKRPKDALIAAMAIMGALALVGLAFPDPLLGLFLTDAQIDVARTPFRVVCIAVPMMTVTGVYATTLLAIGASRTIAWMAVLLRFVIALPLSWLFAVYWGWGVLGVVVVDAAMSFVRMVLSLQAISRPRWTQIQKGDIDPAQIDDGM
jgi:Na+-driven multidrug efflux pump